MMLKEDVRSWSWSLEVGASNKLFGTNGVIHAIKVSHGRKMFVLKHFNVLELF